MNDTWKKIIKYGIATLVAMSISSSLFIVDQKEQAIVTRFGDPKKVILNPIKDDENSKKRIESIKEKYNNKNVTVSIGPGLYFKTPFIDRVNKFDRRILRWDGYPEQIPTKDKKYLWVETSVRWYIEDPLKFFTTVGTEDQAHARLDDIVDSTTRNALTYRDLIEIVRSSNRPMQVTEKELEETVQVGKISEGRNKITEEVYKESAKLCEQYGIRIVENGYLITGLTYIDDVKVKVEERMISERERLAEKYRSEGRGEAQKISGQRTLDEKTILSGAYRDAQIIKGTAEANSIQTYAKAYQQNPELYTFLKTLELYRESFGKDTKLILGTDNELLKYFKGANK